jgi:DNA replication protein DnaC
MTRPAAELRGADDEPGMLRIDAERDLPPIVPGSNSETQPAAGTATGERCATCGGAGWVKHAVPFGHPHFGRLFACSCTQANQARRVVDELRALSNLDTFADKTFASLNPFVPGLREILPQILAYAQQPAGWLSLLGPYGVGKTHLAAAIANDVLGRAQPVLFVVVPDLLDHLRATFGPGSTVSFDTRFEQVRATSLLILDDLGTESATPWAREKLYQLLNHRYNLRLATVITSNLKPSQLDARIYSRMCDPAYGQIITITAGDYRRRERRH